MWLSENGFAKEKINNGHKADEVGRLEKKALACVYGEEKHQYLRPVHDAFSIALFLRFSHIHSVLKHQKSLIFSIDYFSPYERSKIIDVWAKK